MKQADMSETTALPGLEEPDKRCVRCKVVKPAEAFHRYYEGRRMAQCAKCRAETRPSRIGRPSQAGKGRTPLQRRAEHLMRKYGISMEQYAQMLESQGGVCAICGKPPKGEKPLAVDHCHQSGRVRALLCPACNRFVGGFEFFRERAEKYLGPYGRGNPLLTYDE